MANTDKDILQQFGAQVITDVKAAAVAQNRVASHRAERSLRQDVTDSTLEVIDGAGYIEWGWERGRGPGKKPPISKIMQWIVDKGLPILEKDRRGVAFAIAITHERKGSLLHRQGGRSGVLTDMITPQRVSNLTETFATKYLNQVTSEILKAFKS
jgi:hypothetical protein